MGAGPARPGEPARPGSVGDLVPGYRLGAGWTQEELAERARLSPRAIGALERGARGRPHRETMRLLAEALELAPADRAAFEAAARRRVTGTTSNDAPSE